MEITTRVKDTLLQVRVEFWLPIKLNVNPEGKVLPELMVKLPWMVSPVPVMVKVEPLFAV